MFLNQLKDFAAKKIVKNNLSNAALIPSDDIIKTVGILFDESYFKQRESLMEELVKAGIEEKNIEILVFRNKIKAAESFDYPVFSHRDITWAAKIEKREVRHFIAREFDLLVNYYDIEKAALLLVSHLSKARFKAGFSSVDKRLNHFMITTTAENHKVFSDELIKYLKILNKLA